MRRIGVVLLVMAMGFVIASPVGAAKPAVDCDKKPNHPSCGGGPQGLVEVSIYTNLASAHEVGDTIYYTFGVTNGSSETVGVTDELTGLNEPVNAGESTTFGPLSYLLTTDDVPGTIGDTLNLINTVTASGVESGETTKDMATVKVTKYGYCNPGNTDGSGVFDTDDGICIWKPAPGDWTISVVPDSNRSTRVRITVRDHVPGNWCPQGITERWRPGDDPVETTVIIPPVPDEWAGGKVCPIGGAAGEFYDVGTPSSFYLDTKGEVTVTSED